MHGMSTLRCTRRDGYRRDGRKSQSGPPGLGARRASQTTGVQIKLGGSALSPDTDEKVAHPGEDPEAGEASATPPPSEVEEASAGDEAQAGEQADVEQAEETPEKPDRLGPVAERIRSDSAQVILTDQAVFLEEPFGFTEDELDEIWVDMVENGEYRDIVRTPDERSGTVYVHSDVLLTVPYAKLMIRTQANDPVYLIVETVRDESKIYPRPTAAAFFENEPFNLALEDVLKHVETILQTEGYSDIHVIHPSNGATYMYSDRYTNEAEAMPIAQWVEVDMYLDSNQ